MSYEFLTLERLDGHVALVTLNRPEKLNALNRGLQEDSRAVLAELAEDDDRDQHRCRRGLGSRSG